MDETSPIYRIDHLILLKALSAQQLFLSICLNNAPELFSKQNMLLIWYLIHCYVYPLKSSPILMTFLAALVTICVHCAWRSGWYVDFKAFGLGLWKMVLLLDDFRPTWATGRTQLLNGLEAPHYGSLFLQQLVTLER